MICVNGCTLRFVMPYSQGSNMTKQIKIDVNTLLNTYWVDTPIHFNGLDFDIDGKDEWIYTSYEPVSMEPCSVGFDGYYLNGVIKVTVYARKENRCFELVDLLAEVLRVNKLPSVVIHSTKVSPKGIMNTTNGDYSYVNLNYYVKNY